MSNACAPQSSRSSPLKGIIALAFLAMFPVARSAPVPTDITDTPLIVTSSAQAKPNIMLLMDNSGSMGRTHMPDEIESITGVTSIGYKSPQCNALYYNPTGSYLLPKKYDGFPFATPTFNAAPYAGYGAFFTTQDLSVVDLRSQFSPYEYTVGRQTVLGPVVAPTVGAAFYYIYTGPEPLKYDTAPCTQADTGASAATPGGGFWQRVDVSTRPLVEQDHFALWYSFYRTRLGLTKSAASLAFAPLDASKRVGFITVLPKVDFHDALIDPNRYLQMGDFTTVALGQKENWYKKLFSQIPGGSSPTREGLARVGRYYAGKTDLINAGMGGPDPMQFACQQNFTILTTDGYWNGQSESPGGGGLNVNGTALVGQQDGNPTCNVSDPYCVRPIFDGNSADIHNVTNKTNTYSTLTCSLDAIFRHVEQQQRKVFYVTRDTTRTQQEIIQYKFSSSQRVATSKRTVKTVQQTTKTVDQYSIETNTPTQERYKVLMWQDKIVRDTEQFQRQTRQQTAQTLQNTESVTQTFVHNERWQTASTQYGILTTQFKTSTTNFKEGKQQVKKRQWQYIGTNNLDETSSPQSSAFCPAGYTCSIYESFPQQLVDPATCTMSNVTGPNADLTQSYLHTDCSPGPLASAYQPVSACSPGVTPNVPRPATGPNDQVRITCDQFDTAPDFASGYTVATCVPSSQAGTSPFTITNCTVAQNSPVYQTATCTPAAPSTSGYPFVYTQCVMPALTNYAATDSAPCDELLGPQTNATTKVTTVCTKSLDQSPPAPPLGAGCSNNPGTSPPYLKTTCFATGPVNTLKPFASCSASPPTFPTYTRTDCNRVGVAPYAVATPVQWMTCSAGPNAGPYAHDTVCDTSGANNLTEFISSATAGGTTSSTPASGAPWIDVFVTRPFGSTNQLNVAWDPTLGTCPSDAGTTGANFARSTCTTVDVLVPPTAVDETTCTATTTNASSPFVTTHCLKQVVAGTFTCPGATPTGPPWIYERCGFAPTAYRNVPYGSCTPNSGAGLAPDEICRRSTPSSFVPTVPACLEDLTPSGNNPKITCSGPTVIAGLSGPTDPSSCPAVNGPQVGPNQYDISCVTSPFGTFATPDGVDVCPTPAMNPTTFEVTTCALDASVIDSAPCTVTGSPDIGTPGNHWKTTQCLKNDTFVDMQGSVCAGTVLAQSGTGPEIKCVPNGGATAQPVNLASCAGVVNTSDATPPFDTVTACNSTEASAPWNNFGPATCTPGAGSVVGERIDCKTFAVGSDVLDPTCNPNGPDANGVITTCPPITGSGYKYKVSTTTTLTRTPISGGVPSGPPVNIPVAGSPTAPVDVDGVCYASAQVIPSLPTFPAAPPVPAMCGSPNTPATWPCTDIIPSAGGSINSLADVAQYYYTTDLRPTMANVVRSAGTTGPEEDTAPHQHMTTFVVALGVNGTLKYRSDYFTATSGDFDDIRFGRQDWPVWPDPNLNYANPDNYNNPKSIDDFWHTAVNGRGRFFSANDPTTVIDGLADALAKVDTTSASGAADAISSLTPTSTNNFVYGSSYESGTWIGDLEGFTINAVTGVLNLPRAWSAKALLDTRTFPGCDNRNIYLMRGNVLVDFAWNTVECDVNGATPTAVVGTMNVAEKANFSAANISLLSQFTAYLPFDPQLVAAQAPGAIVNFLRGQRGNEGFATGSLTKLFRKRKNVLGDLVDSQPVYVKQPFADYTENNYQVFKTSNASRASMVYVGGNDGMLHAFYGSVTDPLKGQEAWAVIPSAVLPKMYQLADKNYDRNHQFFVDGTPVASDVFDGTNWHTILVGGFNAGGKGYYALDITNPAAPQALWEFKQDNAVCPAPGAGPFTTKSDCNLGLSFGKPVISKVNTTLGEKWVAIFTSGYNNLNGTSGDGEGYIYVVNAMTGVLIQKISTGAGDGTIPSGLAQINNYVDNVLVNNKTLRAYGGDLLGNIWRFDFDPTTPTATLVGTATKGGTRQPITTRPELAELNGEPFLLVGTGKLLGESDVSYTAVQSVYGIRDKLTAVAAGTPPSIYAPPLRASLRNLEMTQIGDLPTLLVPNPIPAAVRTIACTSNCTKTDGWVVDLAEPGERVNVDMKLVLGTLVFASNVPMDIPCSIGGHSWFNQLDFRTGTAVTTAPLSGTDGVISNYLANSLNVGFNVIQRERAAGNNNPGDFQANARQGDGRRLTPPTYVAPPPFIGKRISWREVVQ